MLQDRATSISEKEFFSPLDQEKVVEGVAFLLRQEVRLGFGDAEIRRCGMPDVEREQQEQSHKGCEKWVSAKRLR